MEKVINVGIGGRSFVIDSDAYDKLDSYLHQFRSKISMGNGQVMDVLDDLECRIAALFSERLKERNREVIDITLVRALFVLGLIMGTASFWLYVIMWLIVPLDRV
jgi:hypothetical protein